MQQTSEFQVGDDVLVVTEWGSGAGPGFLLIHGIGMGRDAYLEFIEALARRGRVTALDLPGFGDAPTPEHALSIPQMAELVADFLTSRAEPPVVAIGHSMGTQVVAELAVQYPQLVSSLVLIGPTVNNRERTAPWQVLRMLQDLSGAQPKVVLRGLVLYAKTGLSWFVRTFHTMTQHRLEDIAPRIAVPTLVMRGADDRVCPEPWVRAVTAAIPGARMQEVPGKSHETMISSAEPVAEIIADFAPA